MGLASAAAGPYFVTFTFDDLRSSLTNERSLELLKSILENYDDGKTKCVAAPDGTRSYKFPITTPEKVVHVDDTIYYKEILIPLYPLFGVWVGYNKEYDVLVFSQT